jgi:hypothetical protein
MFRWVGGSLFLMEYVAMRRQKRPSEGPGPGPKLFELYARFEELCETEGPGAADEGDLARVKQQMTAACVAGDEGRFLAFLSKALLLRDRGTGFDYL